MTTLSAWTAASATARRAPSIAARPTGSRYAPRPSSPSSINTTNGPFAAACASARSIALSSGVSAGAAMRDSEPMARASPVAPSVRARKSWSCKRAAASTGIADQAARYGDGAPRIPSARSRSSSTCSHSRPRIEAVGAITSTTIAPAPSSSAVRWTCASGLTKASSPASGARSASRRLRRPWLAV